MHHGLLHLNPSHHIVFLWHNPITSSVTLTKAQPYHTHQHDGRFLGHNLGAWAGQPPELLLIFNLLGCLDACNLVLRAGSA
eukprot:scaffold74817_cov17-Tisochrysis_lutea.AAC.1